MSDPRGRILRFMRHRYTWQTRTATVGEDAWGNPLEVFTGLTDQSVTLGLRERAVPLSSVFSVPSRACLFQDQGVIQMTPQGPLQVDTPVLVIPPNDPLAVGDVIMEVTDSVLGTVLMTKSARVESMTDFAPKDMLLYREAYLRWVEVD